MRRREEEEGGEGGRKSRVERERGGRLIRHRHGLENTTRRFGMPYNPEV
jgi:hypothetical protein